MRILIVEDEPRLADALKEILCAQKYMTDTVYNGLDALAYAKSGIYDCILLDVMLPMLDGFSVLKKLREDKCQTPILMLTAKDTVKDKVTGLDLGADDYMTKPFSTEELLARIRVITRRRGEVILDEISFSEVVYTMSNSTLCSKKSGKSVHLSYKESELIKLFLASPRVILSKEELITKVWGYDSDATDNNVEAYISFLRKKLSFIGADCEIVSVKKLGYKLEVRVC